MLDPIDAEMILSCLPIGQSRVREWLRESSAPELLANPPEEIKDWKKQINLDELKEKLKKNSARWVPAKKISPFLLDLSDAPLGLFAKGPFDPSSIFNSVAIVGTRQPTEYGKKFARELASYLAQRAVPVVSGLALGIDAAAHQGALEAEGSTIGVLGTGIDIVYPAENKQLFDGLSKTGLLLSEFPFGRPPDRTGFPRRNRLIVALASAVVVVESDEAGGAMITASIAKKLGRRLFALPGRVDQATARGPHKLIQDGATLVTSPEDFYRCFTNRPPPLQPDLFDDESAFPAVRKVVKSEMPGELVFLEEGDALSLDEISAKSKIPIVRLSALVMDLELRGLLSKRLDGKYEAV
jgi:DNA processing protein